MIQETRTRQRVKVTNRAFGDVGYTLQNGVRRNFTAGQSMFIDTEELDLLSGEPGGSYLLKNYFIIEEEEVLDKLNIVPEPEYYYTQDEVTTLLTEGTLDQLEDCLNFAPEGVIDLIKDIAVKIELPDTRKRKLILDKIDFNIDNAILITKELAEPDKGEAAPVAGRKAAPIKAKASTATPVRKTDAVIKPKDNK